MNPIPSFFKAFILPNSSQGLLLPEALVKHITTKLPEQVLLRNHRGKIWLTKITNSRNKLYFTDGWEKFVDENNIKHKDILVFDFDGNYVFDVKVYGTNTCNKKASEYSGEELDSESIEYEESEDEKESDDESEEFTGDESHKDSEKEECYTENEKKGNEKMAAASSYENRKEKELVLGNNQSQNKGVSLTRSTKRKESTKNTAKKEEAGNASEDKNEVFKHGIYARPKTPHFLTKLRQKRTNELLVPSEVIKDFNLELGEKMTILDEMNRKWEAKVKVWKDGRTWLVDGWRAFCKWNDLKWEDKCLCEFVREMGTGELYLKIRILRAGSWLPMCDAKATKNH